MFWKMYDFYSDEEPWTPKNNEYPTWDAVVRYYISRTNCYNKQDKGDVIAELSTFVHDIWESGDGCPKTWQGISYQF